MDELAVLAFGKLVKALEELAPEVWQMVLLQVKVEMIQYIIFIVVTIVLLVLFMKAITKLGGFDFIFNDYHAPAGSEMFAVFGIVILAIMSVTSIIFLLSLPGFLINPEYQAIKLLIGMVN